MDMPIDEDGVVEYAITKFTEKKNELANLKNSQYSIYNYPGKAVVEEAISIIDEILMSKKDSVALLKAIVKNNDNLLDSADDMIDVEAFFKNQKALYDNAQKFYKEKQAETDYFQNEHSVLDALANINTILQMQSPYKRIAELSTHIQTIEVVYAKRLTEKKEEVFAEIQFILADITSLAKPEQSDIVSKANSVLGLKKNDCNNATSLTVLDAMFAQLSGVKAQFVKELMAVPTAPDKKVKVINKNSICASANLESEADVDKYLEDVKQKLMDALKDNDTIQLI
jgi:hypothetical protein